LGGLIIAYMVQNFFVFDSLNSYILAVLLLVVTVFLANDKRVESTQVAPSDNKMWIAIALFFIVLINGYYFNIPAARANKDFVYNFKALRDVHPSTSFDEEANQDLIDTMNNNYLGRFEFRQVYSEYAYALLQVKETPIYKKGRTMELAETALLGSIEEQSDNVRHYSFLANLYLAGALTDPMYAQKNIKLIEENALELSPTRTQLYYTLGSAYMTLQKHEESIESFIKAKDLSPHVFESYQNLLSAYLSSDRTEEAKELLATIEDNAILSAAHYSNLGKILNYFSLPEEAVIYMESAVEHYPQDGNLLIQLIVYYDAMDEQEKVKAGLEKLKIIDPALADRLNINLDL
jgi:tetratricopeptide (TPR) repeat protein